MQHYINHFNFNYTTKTKYLEELTIQLTVVEIQLVS